MTKKLVDSNILIYSTQKELGVEHEIANKVIDELTSNREMAISVQNLAEMCRVLLEKTPVKQDADDISKQVLGHSKFALILTYSPKTIILANQLSKQHKIHFFDALLAATMQENSIDEIITENADDFKKIPWIKATNPFDKKHAGMRSR